MSRKLPPLPWSVVQHNQNLKGVFYKPVDLCDAQGKPFLRVGDDDKALAIANAIVGSFTLLQDGLEAAEEVVDKWEEGDLAGAVHSLEIWADEASDALAAEE